VALRIDLKTPYPTQQKHINMLCAALNKHHAALDASATGTGKTLCAAVAIKTIQRPVLVICPKAVMPSWKKELKEQGVECLGVINYEKLRAGKTGLGRWENKKWVWELDSQAAIVWDEVHRCKNPTAKNTKMLIAAKPYINLMLSATVADSPTELRGVGYVLGLFELQKFWNWCRAHGCRVNPWGAMEFDHKNTGALKKIHNQIMPDRGSRMSIEDMSGHFAENFIIDDPLDFSDKGKIQKLYAEMDLELEQLKSEMASDSKNPAAQALVMQLRARQAVELCKVPLIVELIEDIRDSGRSAAVFVNFEATIKALLERLQQTEATVSIIQGGQSESEREQAICRFQSGESNTIICNMEAGGVGVSLHDTTGLRPRTALISPNFNAKSLVQVLGRIHRAGGKSPAIQRILVAEGTVEEKVAKAVKEKIKSQEILNGAGSSLSNDASGVYYPTDNEKTETKPMQEKTDEIDHAEHSPSALKMFEICPGYKPKCFDYVQEIIAAKGERVVAIHKEVRFEIDLGGGESTFGTCDLCVIFESGDMYLIDYKTGCGAVEDAEINTQAWAYSIGAFQKFVDVKKVLFYFPLPGRDEVSYAEFTKDDLPKMKYCFLNCKGVKHTPEATEGAASLSNDASGVYYPTDNEKTETKPMQEKTDEIDHASRDHAEHSPSALKMFEICPGYKPNSKSNWAADRGTRIHEALEAEDISRLVDPDEQAIAQKCFDYVQEIIAAKGERVVAIHKEVRFEIDLGGGESTFGTCDLCVIFESGDMYLIDYKTGYGAVEDAEINTQAWAYSIGAFQKFVDVKKVLFYFLLPVRDEVSYAEFTKDDLPKMKLRLQTIIKRAKDGEIFNPQPGVCDYCDNQAKCPALAKKALLIASKYPETGFPVPNDITGVCANADELSSLLNLAPIMESWAEGVRKLALEKTLVEGWELPGFRLQEKKSPRSVTSALLAYEAVKDTVSIKDFLAACSKVSVPDLEKYFAESIPRGKKGQAKQELVDRLTDAGCLKQDGTIHVLKRETK
jgi:hypothetical protein